MPADIKELGAYLEKKKMAQQTDTLVRIFVPLFTQSPSMKFSQVAFVPEELRGSVIDDHGRFFVLPQDATSVVMSGQLFAFTPLPPDDLVSFISGEFSYQGLIVEACPISRDRVTDLFTNKRHCSPSGVG